MGSLKLQSGRGLCEILLNVTWHSCDQSAEHVGICHFVMQQSELRDDVIVDTVHAKCHGTAQQKL